jgi:AcrR family transcriptional regulator
VARSGRKVPAVAKRERIIEVTLRLVADEGIEGATTARIAGAAGVSEGTLYRLYGSKRGILLAAVDAVHDHFLELMETAKRDGVVDTFRELGRLHTESMVGGGIHRLIAPLFAFMTAPPSLGLREAVARRQGEIIERYAAMLKEAQAKGELPAGADVRQAAWTFAAIFWAEDLSTLLGLPGFVLEGRARKALNATLRCFVSCAGCPDTTAEVSALPTSRTRSGGSEA